VKILERIHLFIRQYSLLILLAPVFLSPIIFMFVSSLKPGYYQFLRDSTSLRAFLPVGNISFANYKSAFDRAPVFRFIFNSVLVTSATVVLGLLVNSMVSFALVFLNWKGKNFLITIVIVLMIVPFETIAIPLLLIVSRLLWIGPGHLSQGWQNTYLVQIIPFVANTFSIYLFYQFFKSLPKELVEVARIDGATWMQVYRNVIIPISGPVFGTVTIITFLPMWNQYLWPVMVIQIDAYRPVMVGAGYFQSFGEIMAYLSMITTPVLILFLGLQRAFMESIATTGIKG